MMPLEIKSPRIIFMGTPEFAVASLAAIIEAGFNVVAVVTAPDKPAGRGMSLTETAVKKFAVSKDIPVLQPVNLKDPEFIQTLGTYKADLQVVVAFRMLPEIVWNMPPMGTINLHGSLLPQYRGAAPINWALINGESETGVTTFKLQHAIDTGNILLQERIPLTDQTTAGQLHDTMKATGSLLLVKTIKGIVAATLQEKPQLCEDEVNLKMAPKIHSKDCVINFNKTTENVHNQVRGLSPIPGAYTHLNGKYFKIFLSEKEIIQPPESPGTPVTDGKDFLKFACTDGYLLCKEVQLEGKKRMNVAEFLRGYRFE
jgi:methionyl-tRNA formyltransferase